METKPLISIIVPVYNCEQYIDKCISSILDQTYKNIEVICIDDGSPDNSAEILDSYAEKDKRVKVIHKKNGGVSFARNDGIKAANGKFIVFVDGDDWIDTDTVSTMVQTATENNADVVMCCYVKEFSDHSVTSHIFDGDVFYQGADLKNKIHRRLIGPLNQELATPQNADILIAPWMQLFKAKVCCMYEFYDINKLGTFEDGLYQIDVYRDFERFVYIDRPFYHYRKDNETSITTKYKADLFDKRLNLYNIIENKINEWNLDECYREALNNRVALSMIGIGLNEIKADKNIFKKAAFLKDVLKTPRYKTAFKSLTMKHFPIHWWVFFALCKLKFTLLLVLMLETIEFLRKRVK